MNASVLGAVLKQVGSLADELITTDKERMTLQNEARRIEQAIDLAQIEVNQVEAANFHWFVAGWRPAVGWVCGLALAYAAIVDPMARFAARVFWGYEGDFPELNSVVMLEILGGMLGLSGLRTFEKVRG